MVLFFPLFLFLSSPLCYKRELSYIIVWCGALVYDSLPLFPSDQALSEARATLEQIKEEVQAWKKRHGTLHKKLRKEKATNSTLMVISLGCGVIAECNI